jgi:hypothetical protein
MELKLTIIRNDSNGNPRFVVHFLALLTVDESHSVMNVSKYLDIALPRGRKIGGRKFNNKSFGGGIVFQSYATDELMGLINEVTGRGYTSVNVTTRIN